MNENIQSPNDPNIIAVLGDEKDGKGGKKKKRRRWLIQLLVLLLLIGGILGALYLFGGDDDPVMIGAGVKEGAPGTTVTDDEEEREPGGNGTENFSIELNGRPVFADGNSEGNLNIVNPAVNLLSIEVEIRLNDTDEVVYQSGAIPPNHYIDNDKLTKVLKQGEYPATAYVSMVNPDAPDQQYNRAKFDLVLTIEN